MQTHPAMDETILSPLFLTKEHRLQVDGAVSHWQPNVCKTNHKPTADGKV